MKKFLPIFIFTFLTLPITVFAKEGVLDRLGCLTTGRCGLTDVETGLKFLTNWLIGGIGALGLMFFIWGAIQWITSYGSSEKISHGRDIMMGSIAAIIVAFISFLLVQFFINDVLLGGGGANTTSTSQFMVSAECVDKPQETRCNQPQINYTCTGTLEGELSIYNNLCVTRCDLEAIKTGKGWVCLNNGSYSESDVLRSVANGCPVKFQTCVLPIEGLITPTIPDFEVGIIDMSGCCVHGNNSCNDVDSESDCADGFYFRSCSEVNECQPGFVEQESGCCVESGGDFDSPQIVGCQTVVYGNVCQHTFVSQDCNELDYCP